MKYFKAVAGLAGIFLLNFAREHGAFAGIYSDLLQILVVMLYFIVMGALILFSAYNILDIYVEVTTSEKRGKNKKYINKHSRRNSSRINN